MATGRSVLVIKDDLIVKEIPTPENVELIAAQVECKGRMPMIVCALYRPPNSSIDYMADLCNCIVRVVTQHRNCPVWIGGDINLPDIDWNTNSISGNSTAMAINNLFLQCLEDCCLEQMVLFPTRGTNPGRIGDKSSVSTKFVYPNPRDQ